MGAICEGCGAKEETGTSVERAGAQLLRPSAETGALGVFRHRQIVVRYEWTVRWFGPSCYQRNGPESRSGRSLMGRPIYRFVHRA